MSELSKKVVLITGASRGIGEAAARHLADHGAAVILQARSKDAIEATAQDIITQGGRAHAIQGDVASFADVAAAVQGAIRQFGRLDVLVNNAGVIDPIAHLAQSDPQEWSKVVDINLKGVYYGIRAALPPMLERGQGTIINISSGAASNALEGWSHYCATKAAVLMLTKATDKEYRDQGIRALGLSPGTVATGMQVQIKASGINPVSQLDPDVHIPTEWVARAIAYLCGEGGKNYLGTDMSLRAPESREVLGLPAP